MTDERKQKLVKLGPEPLADALLLLTTHSDTADQLVDKLIATPKENIQRFKKKIAGLKRSKRFIHYRESAHFAGQLEMMLDILQAGTPEPLAGLQCVASFFETDDSTFGRCDDSSGHVGDVYRHKARNLFVEYGSRCSEKKKIADIILKVIKVDDYGIRDTLIDCTAEVVSEPEIRDMIATLQERADGETDIYEKRHHLRLIESLARQINDAELFERTRIANWGELPTAALLDIAEVYLESDDVQTAYERLKKIPADETYQAGRRDALLSRIYRTTGETDKLTEILHRKFRIHPTPETLEELLDVIGEERREEIIARETSHILARSSFDITGIRFLLSQGKVFDAAEHIIDRADLVEGDNYSWLIPLAETMEEEQCFLAATILYRSLLTSILERGYTKAYSHGVRYLCKLDTLSATVADWKQFDSHEKFKDKILAAHGRKHSFWSKYKDRQ